MATIWERSKKWASGVKGHIVGRIPALKIAHPGAIDGDKLFTIHRWPKTFRGKQAPYGTNQERWARAHKK